MNRPHQAGDSRLLVPWSDEPLMPGRRQFYLRQMNRSRQAGDSRLLVPWTDEPRMPGRRQSRHMTAHTMQTSVPQTDEPLTPCRRQSYHRQMNRSRQADVSRTTGR